jgi:hypothetical protein
MRLQASPGFTFHGVTFRTVSLLAVLLLNIALIGPASVLIVQEAIEELGGGHDSFRVIPGERQAPAPATGHSTNYSSGQVGKGADEDSGKKSEVS